jgi:hypothetical protein
MESVNDTPTRRDTCEGPLRAVKPNMPNAKMPGTTRLSASPRGHFGTQRTTPRAACSARRPRPLRVMGLGDSKEILMVHPDSLCSAMPGSLRVREPWLRCGLADNRLRTTTANATATAIAATHDSPPRHCSHSIPGGDAASVSFVLAAPDVTGEMPHTDWQGASSRAVGEHVASQQHDARCSQHRSSIKRVLRLARGPGAGIV